ncbi:MAG: MaoC family dehydratase [Casimicrobiaceae bacterium]
MARNLTHTVSQGTFDRYGRINGDNDIIHYDDVYAKQRGFRGTLAHGLMVMGYMAELAAKQHGDAWYRGGRLKVKWVAPVCPGDTVVAVLGDDGTLHASVGDNETVLVGEASVASSR